MISKNFTSVRRDVFETTLTGSQGSGLMLNLGLSLAGRHVAEKLRITRSVRKEASQAQ